jgi:hypothetical protein
MSKQQKQSNNVATNKSLYRFSIKVTSLQESVVTDNETGKTYTCKNVWYTRSNTKRFYVNVEAVAGKAMKSMFSFPWYAEIVDGGKLKGTNPVGMVHETDLAGKQAVMITEDMFV